MNGANLNQVARSSVNVLTLTIGIFVIVMGLDKYTNFLTDWGKYTDPYIAKMLPFPIDTLMIIIGIVEVIAGTALFMKPSLGGIFIAIWLTIVSITLVMGGNYLDVAARNMVMAICAFTLSRLSLVTS